jgi:hypothetical protein
MPRGVCDTRPTLVFTRKEKRWMVIDEEGR